jgi:hypothetical protein
MRRAHGLITAPVLFLALGPLASPAAEAGCFKALFDRLGSRAREQAAPAAGTPAGAPQVLERYRGDVVEITLPGGGRVEGELITAVDGHVLVGSRGSGATDAMIAQRVPAAAFDPASVNIRRTQLPGGTVVGTDDSLRYVSYQAPGGPRRPGRVSRIWRDEGGRLRVQVDELELVNGQFSGRSVSRELTEAEVATLKTSDSSRTSFRTVGLEGPPPAQPARVQDPARPQPQPQPAQAGPVRPRTAVETDDVLLPDGRTLSSIDDRQFISIADDAATGGRRSARVNSLARDPNTGTLYVEIEEILPNGTRRRRALTEAELSSARPDPSGQAAFRGREIPVTRAPQAQRIEPQRGMEQVESAAFTGADRQAFSRGLRENRLQPTEVVEANGARYTFSDPVQMSDGRIAVIGVVEVNGQRSVQVFYRSHSSAEFRLLPARNEGLGNMGIPEFEKGPGEFALALPNEVQQYLADRARTARRGVPDEVIYAGTRRNRSPIEWSEGNRAPGSVNQAVRTRAIAREPTRPLVPRPGKRRAALHPSDAVAATPGARPDFRAGPVRSYRTQSTLSGELDVLVYRSADGSLEYSMYRDASGRVSIGNVRSTRPGVSAHGVQVDAVDPSDLTMPRWEYDVQTPEGYAGRAHPNRGRYVDAWAYIREMPDIQEWYRSQGLPVPP